MLLCVALTLAANLGVVADEGGEELDRYMRLEDAGTVLVVGSVVAGLRGVTAIGLSWYLPGKTKATAHKRYGR